MIENELTEKIIGGCIEIHKILGPGLLESLYEQVLCYELKQRNIPFTNQQIIPVKYKDVILEAGFRADIIVDSKVIIEIKSVEKMNPVYSKQLLTYLKLTNIRLGLLINFNAVLLKDGIERIINGY